MKKSKFKQAYELIESNHITEYNMWKLLNLIYIKYYSFIIITY